MTNQNEPITWGGGEEFNFTSRTGRSTVTTLNCVIAPVLTIDHFPGPTIRFVDDLIKSASECRSEKALYVVGLPDFRFIEEQAPLHKRNLFIAQSLEQTARLIRGLEEYANHVFVGDIEREYKDAGVLRKQLARDFSHFLSYRKLSLGPAPLTVVGMGEVENNLGSIIGLLEEIGDTVDHKPYQIIPQINEKLTNCFAEEPMTLARALGEEYLASKLEESK
jgi:hypothetical protein